MRNRALFDALEGRRLLSGVGLTIANASPAFNGTLPAMDGSISAVLDLGGMITVVGGTAKNGLYKAPTLKADGSVSLAGSANADQITVDRLSHIDEESGKYAEEQMDIFSWIDKNGDSQIATGVFTTEWMTKQLETQKGILKTFGEDLADVKDEEISPDESSQAQHNKWINDYTTRLSQQREVVATTQKILDLIQSGDVIRYSLDGIYDFYVEASSVKSSAKINIDAGSGSDSVRVGSNVPLKLTVNGGAGADVITSGKRKADLFGGGGNDRLISRSTAGGTLEGGKGSDKYYSRGDTTTTRMLTRADGDQVALAGTQLRVVGAGTVKSVPSDLNPGLFKLVLDDGKSLEEIV